MPKRDRDRHSNRGESESRIETSSQPPLALRAKEAARLLGISQRSLWTITKRKDIPHVRIGRTVTYPVDALRDWLKKRSKGGK